MSNSQPFSQAAIRQKWIGHLSGGNLMGIYELQNHIQDETYELELILWILGPY